MPAGVWGVVGTAEKANLPTVIIPIIASGLYSCSDDAVGFAQYLAASLPRTPHYWGPGDGDLWRKGDLWRERLTPESTSPLHGRKMLVP